MSVSVEFARAPDGWPGAVTRGSKLAVVPPAVEKSYKDRLDYIDACLGTWEFLRRSDGERASFLAALQRVALEPAAFAAEVQRAAGFAPPPKGTYNGQPWGDWENVADALTQAETIRRSYAAAAKGPAAEATTRIDQMRADLKWTAVVAMPAKPEGVVDPAAVQDRVNAQVVKLGRIKFLGQSLEDLTALIEGEEFAAARAIVGQFVVDRVDVPRQTEERTLADLNRQLESGAKSWTKYREQVAAAEANAALRQRLSEALQRAESDLAAATKSSGDAAKRRESWDKICDALKPDGKVAAALSSMATRAIDMDRFTWATDMLGVRVSIGSDGGVQVLGRSSSQPSRGEQLLAALALQDAACMLADVPVMLVDELEALDPGSLTKALGFLTAASEDYEAVLCCRTTGVPLPASWRPAGVQLWTAGRGVLTAVS